MKEYAAGIKISELRLVEAPGSARTARPADGPAERSGEHHDAAGGGLRASGATNAAGMFAPSSGSATDDGTLLRPNADGAAAAQDAADAPPVPDKFLTAATKELQAGIVDQPLWRRAVEQSGPDRTLATQRYLRARATALRVTKREKRQERSARRERAMNELAHPGEERAGPSGEIPETATGPAQFGSGPQPKPEARRRPGLRPRRGQVVWIGGALAALFAVAVVVAVRSESGTAQQRAAVKTPPPASAAAAKRSTAEAAAASASQPSDASVHIDNFVERIPALKSAGNWNMVVLYAVEWMRKEPENPAPWRELVTGYSKLRQYREALDAATRVVQLAPDDASAWQSLGQLNVIAQRPVDALAAFEEAIARNDRDASSMVQMGLLNTQLGRFPEARLAFARALALDGHDLDALCGAAALARKEGRAKDADGLAQQIAALDRRCRDPNQGESVRVAVDTPAPRPSATR